MGHLICFQDHEWKNSCSLRVLWGEITSASTSQIYDEILHGWRILALGDPQKLGRDEPGAPGEAAAPCSGR